MVDIATGQAVEQSFGADIDYAMLVKHYGTPESALGRYSPCECTGISLRRVEGRPDLAHVSTSAMAAGVSTTLCELADMVKVLETWEASKTE